MVLDKDNIAQSIMAELKRDEKQLTELQQKVNELTERVGANRLWLKAYGFSENGSTHKQATMGPAQAQRGPSAVERESDGTIPDIAAQVLREEGKKTMTELYEGLLARGKKIHRASLDVAIRRNPERFEMKKRGRKNVISLRESINTKN